MTATMLRAEAFASPPEAVLLDIDNTVYAYDPAHRAAMERVTTKVVSSFGIAREAFHEAFARARNEVKHALGATASAHSRLLYFQRALELIGLGSQPLMALDLEQTYWRTLLSSARLFDGVREFLDDLRLRGVPAVVVTDLTAQIQLRKLVYFGLDRYFDFVVTSEEAGADKPSPLPFELALRKLKEPRRTIWMVGDNPATDILGARRAIPSVATIQKVHGGVVAGTGDGRPDAVVVNFAALRALLKQSYGE